MKREIQSIQNTSITFWLDRISRWLLATVFVVAGGPKLLNPTEFAEIIGAYGLLPEILLLPAAIVLPLAELVLAWLLISGRKEGLWGTVLLMGIFLLVLGYGIHQGLDIDCGCFGPEDPEHKAFSGLRIAFLRDLLLCIPLIYGIYYSYRIKRT